MVDVCNLNGTECGTGSWKGPKPGDPNMNNLLLTATPAFGGIDINWTWPTLNPAAVSQTILWRSITPNFNVATRVAVVQGNFYFDRVDVEINLDTRYYYWIQMLSINGTEGEVIGPASATARPLIGQMMDILSGQIDAGALAQNLRTEIDQIQLNKLGITQEELLRAQNDQGLAVRISELGAKTDDALALLQEEVRIRTDADGALVHTVNTMYADFNGNIAAIQTEQQALATQVSSLASSVTTLNSTVNGNSASGQIGLVTKVTQQEGKMAVMESQYFVKLQAGNLVGGFGLYNQGQTIEAGFDVDRFWIGRANVKRKPFIIDNNIVYIDEGAINKLTFDKLRAQDGSLIVQNGKIQAKYLEADQIDVSNIQSKNWVSERQGWRFWDNGTYELNGTATSGRTVIKGGATRVYDAAGVLRVIMGVW